MSDCHWSTWRHVEAGIGDDVAIDIACWSLCNQPYEQAQPVNSIYMRVHWDDIDMTIGVPIAPQQLGSLVAALVDVQALAEASRLPDPDAEPDAAGNSGPGWPWGGAQ